MLPVHPGRNRPPSSFVHAPSSTARRVTAPASCKAVSASSPATTPQIPSNRPPSGWLSMWLPVSTGSNDGPDVLPRVIGALMRDIGIPNGLAEVGYGDSDVDDLVAGALQQQRLLATSPRSVTDEDLARIFRASMGHW